jgi:hypothetical protein
MSLRFQKEDEVDREIKERRRADAAPALLVWSAILVCYMAGAGLYDWLNEKSLKSYGQEIGWPLTFVFLMVFARWFLSPIYNEFRARTKEIDGKVSAVEKAVTASKENHAELLEKLTAIEERLEALSEKVENLNPGEGVAYSTGGIREGLRTIEEKLGRSEPQR